MPSHGLTKTTVKTHQQCTPGSVQNLGSDLLRVFGPLFDLRLQASGQFVQPFTGRSNSPHELIVGRDCKLGAVAHLFPLVDVIHTGLVILDLLQDSLPE